LNLFEIENTAYLASGADSLSVIVRFHSAGNLDLLTEALKSIQRQNHQNLQIILCLQNCAQIKDAILEKLKSVWQTPPQTMLIDVEAHPGQDFRARLLNLGISHSSGRFVSFLDYDDILFDGFHSSLISRLINSPNAVAVCGTVCSYGSWLDGSWNETRSDKFFEYGKGKLDLLKSNFIPLHSYVADTSKFDRQRWQTSESLSRFEDYLLLLKVAAQCEFDFYYHNQVLCEYRIRDDGSNSTLQGKKHVSSEEKKEWADAFQYIQDLKPSLVFQISASELENLIAAAKVGEAECSALKKLNQSQESELSLLRQALQRKSVVLVSKVIAGVSGFRAILKSDR